jgi:putative membrane protein insertion efficiency factor
MKTIILFIITLYQRILSPSLKQLLGSYPVCRYSPSCSEYARIAVTQHGVVKGGWLALLRFLSCMPNAKTRNTKHEIRNNIK